MTDTSKKRFMVAKNTGFDEEDVRSGRSSGVFGGSMGEGNVYLNVYAVYDDKRHTSLEIGQSCRCSISLSGETGKYIVIRTEDKETPDE